MDRIPETNEVPTAFEMAERLEIEAIEADVLASFEQDSMKAWGYEEAAASYRQQAAEMLGS